MPRRACGGTRIATKKQGEERDECMMGALFSPPSDADRSHWILRRLRLDHRSALASVDLLQTLSNDPPNFASSSELIDQLIDPPDDIHHYVEKRLYRRLWYRLGVFLPSCFDLDEWHDERRERRLALMQRLDESGRDLPWAEAALAALSGFCKCIRNQIEDEERRFFPLIETRLTEQDWLNIEDEVSAYDETWRRLNSIHLTGRADIPFARPA
ncbi:MAG: hemerythrin domain-containing protein [Parvularculaceae bacterium]